MTAALMIPVFVLIYGFFEPDPTWCPTLLPLLGALHRLCAPVEYWTFAKRDGKQFGQTQ
jgi:hypothetical protein